MAKYTVSGTKDCGQAFKQLIEAENVEMLGHYLKFVDANGKVVALFDNYSAKRVIREG